ncbi:MAG: hypothetical protein H6739_22370 [Alphaproteobacteria bacterium]|nr:hypothetical protein [Alphaproteobacteria bacterium]
MSLLLLLACVGADDLPAEPKRPTERGVAVVSREGRWALAPEALPMEEQIAQLQAIGYVEGSQPAPATSGVVVHDPARAWAGYNLYTSGHGPEAVLMDMAGRVLHTWRLPFDEAFPGQAPHNEKTPTFWRRARALPDGGLLAIFEGHGIVRLDRDSKPVWARFNGAHHDLKVDEHGDIWLLTREARPIPSISADRATLEDFVTVLGPDGTEKRRISVLDAALASDFAALLTPRREGGDVYHTNTLTLLDGRAEHPAFTAGRVLLSMRTLSTLAVLDLDAQRVVWATKGSYHGQHDPRMLDDGRVLLFDNGRKASRVLALDPTTLAEEVVYGPADRSFFSKFCGAAQRTPAGTTLITESDAGRALEVTPEGEVVWAFYNPHRAGADGGLIATLFEVQRLPPDFPVGWAQHPPER